jgi:hypothetical protein
MSEKPISFVKVDHFQTFSKQEFEVSDQFANLWGKHQDLHLQFCSTVHIAAIAIVGKCKIGK